MIVMKVRLNDDGTVDVDGYEDAQAWCDHHRTIIRLSAETAALLITPAADQADRLHGIEASLNRLHRKADRIMGLAEDLKAGMAKLDTATSKLATKMQELIQASRNPNITEAERTEILGHLDALATQLDGFASDPADPVPAPTPAVQAALAFKPKKA